MIAVAIYEAPFPVSLLELVLRESGISGSPCYTSEDYQAVIELMARGHYDTTGWVSHIQLEDVIEGIESLHAGKAMKLLVEPS